MEELTIAFLSGSKFEGDAVIRGAVLVTDNETKPLEFRVTAPIRPTNFQKTLYGEILLEHILVELIALPLLNSISKKPDVIVVRDALFLGANDRQQVPIVRIFKDDEARFSGDDKTEAITCISGKYEPILVETSRALEEKLPEFRRRLSGVFSARSLLEPFDRILTALQQVHSQKPGE